MNKTKIEWCTATLNPVVGCSFGCPYCYAERINRRFHYVEDFTRPEFFPDRLQQLRTRSPQNIFLTSMSDPADWRPEWIIQVLDAIEANPQHRYLFLSKRPEAYTSLFPLPEWRKTLKNIWYGTTVTRDIDLHRIAELPLDGKRFVSFEPLLGPANPRRRPITAAVPWIDWAIIGAETGPAAKRDRPARKWIDEIVAYCDETGVPVFMKDSLLPIVGEEGMRRDFPAPLVIY